VILVQQVPKVLKEILVLKDQQDHKVRKEILA
jgi:hypothetical protein